MHDVMYIYVHAAYMLRNVFLFNNVDLTYQPIQYWMYANKRHRQTHIHDDLMN